MNSASNPDSVRIRQSGRAGNGVLHHVAFVIKVLFYIEFKVFWKEKK